MQPEVPQFISVAQVDNTKAIYLHWLDQPLATYALYRDGNIIANPITGNEYTDSDIEYDKQYIYAVTAVLGDIESARSVPVATRATSTGQPFATVDDLTNFWRAPDDTNRATYLLRMASNKLRMLRGDTLPSLDTKASDDPVFKDTLQWVVLEAVKRALITPSNEPSIESKQMAAGPYSENIKYVNPTGDLFFRRSELSALGLTAGQQLGSISTTPNSNIYEREDYGS